MTKNMENKTSMIKRWNNLSS